MCIGLIISQHDFHEIILNSSVVVGRSTWQNDARIKAIVMLQSADVCIRVRSIFEFQVRHINKKIILTTASYFFSKSPSKIMKRVRTDEKNVNPVKSSKKIRSTFKVLYF